MGLVRLPSLSPQRPIFHHKEEKQKSWLAEGFACQPRMPLFFLCYLLHWKGPVTTGKTMQFLHIPTTLNPVAYWKTFHIHEYDTEPFPLKPHADCSSNLWCAILSQWAPENKKLVWEWGFRNERVPPFISTCQLETPSSIFINTQPTAVWATVHVWGLLTSHSFWWHINYSKQKLYQKHADQTIPLN